MGWRRQELIDTGQLPGTTSSDNAELVAARRRIAELETEVAIHRRAERPRHSRRASRATVVDVAHVCL